MSMMILETMLQKREYIILARLQKSMRCVAMKHAE